MACRAVESYSKRTIRDTVHFANCISRDLPPPLPKPPNSPPSIFPFLLPLHHLLFFLGSFFSIYLNLVLTVVLRGITLLLPYRHYGYQQYLSYYAAGRLKLALSGAREPPLTINATVMVTCGEKWSASPNLSSCFLNQVWAGPIKKSHAHTLAIFKVFPPVQINRICQITAVFITY